MAITNLNFRNIVDKTEPHQIPDPNNPEDLGEVLVLEDTQAYLLEAIYYNNGSYAPVTIIDGNNNQLVEGSDYVLNYEAAVINFTSDGLNNYIRPYRARYTGIGSIIWSKDISSLQTDIENINNNALNKNGDILRGSLDLSNNNILNVSTISVNEISNNLINNVNINSHKHTGLDGTTQLDDDSISSLSISKVTNLQDTLNGKQDSLPTPYTAGEFLSNNGSSLIWKNVFPIEEVINTQIVDLNIVNNRNYKLTNPDISDITFSSCDDSYNETTITFNTSSVTSLNFIDNASLTWVDGSPSFALNATYIILIWKKFAFVQEIA